MEPPSTSPSTARRSEPAYMPSSSSGLAAATHSSLRIARAHLFFKPRTGCPLPRPVTTVSESFAFSTRSLYASAMQHSSTVRKRVPTCTPSAPSANAAAMPRPSAMPPAAITGMRTASHTLGTSAIVVSSPMWPPASQPSATTASAPMRSMRAASAEDATTGTTFMPASFQAAMKFAGLPAPVVTTSTRSLVSSSATWGACGSMSMTFAPMGASPAISRAMRTCSSIHASGAPPQAIMPKPPAADTAPASLPSAMRAMAPWMTGTRMPKRSVTRVFIHPPLSLHPAVAEPRDTFR